MGTGGLSRSNVLMAGVNLSGREYVVPTMVEGKRLPIKDAVALARKEGVHNYPSFNTPEEASAFAERYHGEVEADGFLRTPKKPSLVETVRSKPGSAKRLLRGGR